MNVGRLEPADTAHLKRGQATHRGRLLSAQKHRPTLLPSRHRPVVRAYDVIVESPPPTCVQLRTNVRDAEAGRGELSARGDRLLLAKQEVESLNVGEHVARVPQTRAARNALHRPVRGVVSTWCRYSRTTC